MTTPGTEIVELETGIFARLHEGLTNAGIIVGDDGVLVIDSLRVPSYARDLIADVRHITDKPIKYLIDTHSHWDHSWGNEEFPDATIIGHQNCYDEMVDVEWNRPMAGEDSRVRRSVVRRGAASQHHAARPDLRNQHEALLRRTRANANVSRTGAYRRRHLHPPAPTSASCSPATSRRTAASRIWATATQSSGPTPMTAW